MVSFVGMCIQIAKLNGSKGMRNTEFMIAVTSREYGK